MKYKINEIFYSLQGEGRRVGEPSIFIRFANCNLTCGFCDTEFDSYREMTPEEILDECTKYPCLDIVLTGGEPLLSVDEYFFKPFKEDGHCYYFCLETNGSLPIKKEIEEDIQFVSISPKVAEHVLMKNFPKGVDELRYVRNSTQGIPRPRVSSGYFYLSPEFTGDKLEKANLEHCIKLVKENALWNLSLQMHKLLNIR